MVMHMNSDIFINVWSCLYKGLLKTKNQIIYQRSARPNNMLFHWEIIAIPQDILRLQELIYFHFFLHKNNQDLRLSSILGKA